MKDPLGQDISPESLRDSINAWNELWKTGKFDCGPQDFGCMAKEILQKFGLTGHTTQQIASVTCPYCGRETYDPKLALFDSMVIARSTCQHCIREFQIEDGIPKGRTQ